MPSTFTSNTGIELIADGEQTGAWGQTTNDNFDIVDRALNGSVSIALSGTTHTLTTSDGVLSDGQAAVLVFTGSPSGTNTVTIAPNTAQKTYIVRNTTAEDIVLTQGSGGNVTVPAGRSAVVSSNGDGASAAVVDLSAGLVPVLANAGVTATAAELNILDGVTATAAELNILDGVTATAAELNILDGVTATAAELNILDGVTATAAELNILDGVTATAAELNFVDGVTSAIQTQLDDKPPVAREINSGTGILGGGDLTANRTLEIDIASQAEAEAGTDNDKVMTPLRVSEAIDALAGSLEIGDAIETFRSLESPEFILANGTYLRSSFPDLSPLVPPINPRDKLANPATLPSSFGRATAFSVDGTYLAVGHDTTPFITIYKRSGDTFTKLANPSALPPASGFGTAFSPDGTYLSVAHTTSPFITIYKRSGDTFTKLANPSVLPAGTGNGTAFSADGNFLAVAHGTSPFITIYKRDGDTFTKLADPAVLPASNGNGTAFSTDGNFLAVAHNTSPFITIYKRSGDTFTKLADPAALPASTGLSTAFSTDGTYLALGHVNTPFITIYKGDEDPATLLTLRSTSPNVDGANIFIKAT